MSRDNENIQPFQYQESSSSESSIEVRITHRRRDQETVATAGDSDSFDSQLECPKCTVKVRFDIAPGNAGWSKKTATIKVSQDNFHQVQVFAKAGIDQEVIEPRSGRAHTKLSTEEIEPCEFELEIHEKPAQLQWEPPPSSVIAKRPFQRQESRPLKRPKVSQREPTWNQRQLHLQEG